MKRRIVIAGATGYIASQVLPAFQERYDCVLLDVKKTTRDGRELPGVHLADVSDTNLEAYREHFRGADTVVNLVYCASRQSTPDSYFEERKNIDVARNLFEIARQEGVRRVVAASSNHAADWYEQLYWQKRFDKFGTDVRPLSNNFYGWSKEAYEHLGFVYACGALGRPIEVVLIRIGGPREATLGASQGNLHSMVRQLAVYISPRDLQQLFVKSIEAPDIRNEHGVPFQIFFGISGNTRAFWSILNARQAIGYDPQDDSEVKFAEDIARYLVPLERQQRGDNS
ncbi:MAG: NAD(P)-dependent oxidoreductase [Planctomycetes bacterium]|nr:NAD(P)-dependent oxidoreductase [Planctomycetota bacterium]